MAPLIITLKTSVVATLITIMIGIYLAYKVSRLKRNRGLADALIMMPLVMPPTVVGFFLLVIFGKRGIIGRMLLGMDVTLVFSWYAAVIAGVVVSVPLMYRTTRGAFEQLDENMINAARCLGVTERRILWRIMIPNARRGIIAGMVLSFTRVMGEFGATMMFAGNIPGVTQTMSTAIYAAVQANDYNSALIWALSLVMFSLLFLLAMNYSKNNDTR